MVPDDVPPATASDTAVSPPVREASHSTDTPEPTQPTRSASVLIPDPEQPTDVFGFHLDVFTLLVALVGAGLLLQGVVATFAGLFCLGVVLYVFALLAHAEWQRLELSTAE